MLAATAAAMLRGDLLYVQVWNGHQPLANAWMAGVLLVTRGWHPAMQLVLALQVLAATAAVYLIAGRLGGRPAATAILFGLAAGLPVVEGDLQGTEMIGLPLVCWAVLLGIGGGPARAAAAGALGLAAALCHPGYILDVLAIAWFAVLSGRPLRVAPVVAGAVAMAVVVAAVMGAAGDWAAYAGVIAADRAVLAWANGGLELSPIALALRLVPVAVALLAGLAIGAEQRTPAARLLGAWLPLAALDALLTPFGLLHMALPLLAPVCLLLGLWLRPLLVAPALVAVVLALQAAMLLPRSEMFLLDRWPFPNPGYGTAYNWAQLPGYYRAWYDRVLGVTPRDAYEASFPGRPADVARLAGAIKVEGTLAVWGDLPWLYVVSGRRPAGRFVAHDAYYRLVPGADAESVAAIRRERPEYVVLGGPPSKALAQELRAEYDRLVFEPGPWPVYGRHSG